MSNKTRYLFGYTKMDKIQITNYIDLDSIATVSAPTASAGRIYHDTDSGKLKFCADGTNYETVTST